MNSVMKRLARLNKSKLGLCQCHAEKSVDKHTSFSLTYSFFLSLSPRVQTTTLSTFLVFVISLLKNVCNDSQHSFVLFRDVLPFTLKLPEAIAAAKTLTDLEEVAQFGRGEFSSLCMNVLLSLTADCWVSALLRQHNCVSNDPQLFLCLLYVCVFGWNAVCTLNLMQMFAFQLQFRLKF